MQMEGLDAYLSLKQTILAINAGLVAAGTLCESLIWSPQFASLFAVGGIGGLAYQYLLQESVDTIGVEKTEIGKDGLPQRFFATPLSRLLLAGFLAALAYFLIDFTEEPGQVAFSGLPYKAQQLLNFAAGLFAFKLSVLFAALVDSQAREE